MLFRASAMLLLLQEFRVVLCRNPGPIWSIGRRAEFEKINTYSKKSGQSQLMMTVFPGDPKEPLAMDAAVVLKTLRDWKQERGEDFFDSYMACAHDVEVYVEVRTKRHTYHPYHRRTTDQYQRRGANHYQRRTAITFYSKAPTASWPTPDEWVAIYDNELKPTYRTTFAEWYETKYKEDFSTTISHPPVRHNFVEDPRTIGGAGYFPHKLGEAHSGPGLRKGKALRRYFEDCERNAGVVRTRPEHLGSANRMGNPNQNDAGIWILARATDETIWTYFKKDSPIMMTVFPGKIDADEELRLIKESNSLGSFGLADRVHKVMIRYKTPGHPWEKRAAVTFFDKTYAKSSKRHKKAGVNWEKVNDELKRFFVSRAKSYEGKGFFGHSLKGKTIYKPFCIRKEALVGGGGFYRKRLDRGELGPGPTMDLAWIAKWIESGYPATASENEETEDDSEDGSEEQQQTSGVGMQIGDSTYQTMENDHPSGEQTVTNSNGPPNMLSDSSTVQNSGVMDSQNYSEVWYDDETDSDDDDDDEMEDVGDDDVRGKGKGQWDDDKMVEDDEDDDESDGESPRQFKPKVDWEKWQSHPGQGEDLEDDSSELSDPPDTSSEEEMED